MSSITGAWAKLLYGINAAAAAIVAWCYLVPAPPLPTPLHPYREVSRCASGPLDWRLFDANGDDRLDIVILCEEELLVASGLNGDTLWRQDLPRPFAGSFEAPRGLETNDGDLGGKADVLVVKYPKEVLSFDAVTGERLWSKALNRVQPSMWFRGDCLEVTSHEQVKGPENRVTTTTAFFSARSGEACTPPPEPPRRPDAPPRRHARVGYDDAGVTFERGDETLWTSPCDSNCSAQRLLGGVLVRGWVDRCMRILNLSRGEVTRVLKPQDVGWRIETLSPYLIAWRPLDPQAHPAGRPVLEVFDATSFQTRWRSDPDAPEAFWELTDHCEPTLPDTSESPFPLTSTDAVDGPCATGITPRAATGRNDDVVLRLERSPCYGNCSSYVVTILADGTVHYEGRSLDGTPDATLSPSQLDELTRQFRDNRFFDLCDVTKREVTHYPSMTLEFWNGTQVKRVVAYLGNWSETVALREFGDTIDYAVAIGRPRLGPRSTSSFR